METWAEEGDGGWDNWWDSGRGRCDSIIGCKMSIDATFNFYFYSLSLRCTTYNFNIKSFHSISSPFEIDSLFFRKFTFSLVNHLLNLSKISSILSLIAPVEQTPVILVTFSP